MVEGGGSGRFVLQKAHERGVRTVELWAVDPLGRAQSVTVPVDALDQALEDGFVVAPEALGEAFEGAAVQAGQRPLDEVHLAPDAATFSLLPRVSSSLGEGRGVARIICEILRADGSPSALCSRTALKRTLGRATRLGSLFYVGATLQHHWLAAPDDDHPLDDQRRIRVLGEETAHALEALGIAWRAHFLGADGRFCLELDWVDPLSLADAIVTHRRVVHDVALSHGAAATFAPFPWSAPRSRLDLYVSLSRDGTSAFDDALEKDGLAPAGRAFVTALEAEIGGLELVMRSTLHSYVMPEPPLVRRGPSARGDGGATILIRGADACANPYSLLAAVLGLGGEAMEGASAPASRLPPAQTLLEAAHRAGQSSKLKELLGLELIESLGSLGDTRAR